MTDCDPDRDSHAEGIKSQRESQGDNVNEVDSDDEFSFLSR